MASVPRRRYRNPSQAQVPCIIKVGNTELEFWVASDLLDDPPSPQKDRRQDEAQAQCLRSFTMAMSLEAGRRSRG